MDHTPYLGMTCCGLMAAAHGAVPAAEPPAVPAMQQQAPANSSYQCVNPAQQLHAMLARYALKCGDATCPLCNPPAAP
ncbi:hypothetical protein [Aquitalea sp. LB_tupeE]|uniref:hypothetical protein n=1 Tax=Aquitalea sp. LB_tupeE TaxID=2748078 RepID=UPI0015B8A4F5|nr:hypothetical protein [Aquitalea sp. LB_tupeE]NWK79010.1 hypothetical protein [Aquitalea sp. LB_tupeE]